MSLHSVEARGDQHDVRGELVGYRHHHTPEGGVGEIIKESQQRRQTETSQIILTGNIKKIKKTQKHAFYSVRIHVFLSKKTVTDYNLD